MTTKTHRHRPAGEPRITAYGGSVGNTGAPGGTAENQAAHGNIREKARCRCGAIRLRNINGRHVESSGWLEPEERGCA